MFDRSRSSEPPEPGAPSTPTLADLVVAHQSAIRALVRRYARILTRFEPEDDIAQDVTLKLLRAPERFEYRGDDAFLGFLATAVRRHIGTRREYWSARKRDAGVLLRISTAESSESGDVHPAGSWTGPSTFAVRREMLVLAARAVDVLPERDQKIIRWLAEGRPPDEIAGRLELSEESAARARRRAVERFREVVELAAPRRGVSTGGAG